MHDPCTVAFQIKYPWWHYKPWPKKYRNSTEPRFQFESRMTEAQRAGRSLAWENGYRETAITIWHVDPELDGSDNSCGWAFPKLTKAQFKRLWNGAWSEGNYPYFLRYPDKKWLGTRTEAESIYRGLVIYTANLLRIPITFDQAAKFAAERIHNPDCSDTADDLCYLPGYHDNFPESNDDQAKRLRQDHLARLMCGIASCLLRDRRPWYRHPRWHFWHWRIRIDALTMFKRWAFSRCCECGNRFKWGECPTTSNWHATGPLWFRSEKDSKCQKCSGQLAASPKQ